LDYGGFLKLYPKFIIMEYWTHKLKKTDIIINGYRIVRIKPVRSLRTKREVEQKA